jgi:3-(3-hydroxy-phenyl)propionate hydroxylase
MNTATYAEVPFVNGYEYTQGSGYALPEFPFVAPPELTSGEAPLHPIVIVGGGITGLTLACCLARLGQSAILLDEDNTVGVKGASSRGICYTQKSLEVFDRLGIFEAIAAKGIRWSVGRTFAGEDEVYSFDLSQQGNFNLSTQPPFINIQQFYIEGFLAERTQQLGHVELRWQSRVTGFEQNAEFATLTIATPGGSYTLRALHVIDASGAHTPFRAWCGASVTAKKGDDRWCIADVRFSKKPPIERHTWVEAPFNENRAVWQHLMADDVWRIDYQMAPHSDPAEVSRADVVRERLTRQFGPDTEVEIVWVGPYAYRSECIDQMRHGRVFFMGDSAKVVSPFGARGGNTGVADADNLAWKLTAVLRGLATERLLASYHEERHEASIENVLVTNRTARFLRPAEGMERVFRNASIALAKRHPFARQLVNTGRMAVANSYHFSSACTNTGVSKGGFSLQNIAFLWRTGSRSAKTQSEAPAAGTVNDLLLWAGGRHILMLFGQFSARARADLRNLSRLAPVLSVQVLARGESAQATEHIYDSNPTRERSLRQGCGLLDLAGPGTPWALVRPDGYVAATGIAVNGSLVHAVQKSLGM